MPQYIPHPALMGLQQGNDMTNNYMRMYDTQTSNFVNNMARTLAQRELNMYNIMTGGGGGGAAGAGSGGVSSGAIGPRTEMNEGQRQYLQDAFLANLRLAGRTPEGYAIPGARNAMAIYNSVGVAPIGTYGPGGVVANWLGDPAGKPSLADTALFPYTTAQPQPVQPNTRVAPPPPPPKP
jgi:hypothetical protein